MTTPHDRRQDRTIEPAVTTGPITGSRKVYRDLGAGLRVPARRVDLTNGEHLDLYDTSGPYTDSEMTIDVHGGLPRLREPWIADREPIAGAATQLAWARAGVVTPEMEFIAAREGVDVALVLDEVARG
ncbi:MAG: hypothetical protein ACRDQD_22755, partial [Nocardioidaceae bacterium]